MKKSQLMATNPLLQPFAGDADLFPAFDKIKPEHFRPALNFAMAEARRLLKKIKEDPKPASFENTILAFENATGMLDYVYGVFWHYTYTARSPEIERLESYYCTRLNKFYAEIYKDEELHDRIKKLEKQKHKPCFSQQQRYLIEIYDQMFRVYGCGLSEAHKKRCEEIDEEITKLGLRFDNNVQKELKTYGLIVDDIEDLSGLPESIIQSAADEAKSRGLKGKWVLTAEEPIELAVAFFADNRALREHHYREMAGLCTKGSRDNLVIWKQILSLRHERAQIFGYRTYADYAMTYMMAYSKGPVFKFLNDLKKKVSPAARRQHEQLKRYALNDSITTFEPWDFRYYWSKMRKEKLAFDSQSLRPYFSFPNVMNGVFQHCEKLFGVEFKHNTAKKKLHKDTFTFDVHEKKTGSFLGRIIVDPYLRDDKISGGQYCVSLLSHGQYAGKNTEATCVLLFNFARPTKNSPTLLTEEEVKAVFHEFGHGLHNLLGKSEFRLLSGINCLMPDFSEIPSQLNECWGLEPEVLRTYARHWQTGEVMPDELIYGLRKNDRFMGSHKVMRELRRAYLDLAIHNRNPELLNLRKFEGQFFRQKFPQVNFTNLAQILSRFQHPATLGMEAGYFSYLWAEAHEADAYELFRQNGLYDSQTCENFQELLKAAGTRPCAEIYRGFRGRNVTTDALCKRYGIRNLKAVFDYTGPQAANENTYFLPDKPTGMSANSRYKISAHKRSGPSPS